MPRANRHCSFPSCLKKIARNGRCEIHQFERTAPSWQRSTPYEKTLTDSQKRAILARDKQCVTCSSTHHLEVDHIVPKFMGGSDDPTNLQVLCSICHSRKSSMEGLLARRSNAQIHSASGNSA